MSVINSIRSQFAPIHPQGYPFVGGFALASLILFFLWTPLGWIGTLATAWCAYFFRDPVRGMFSYCGILDTFFLLSTRTITDMKPSTSLPCYTACFPVWGIYPLNLFYYPEDLLFFPGHIAQSDR